MFGWQKRAPGRVALQRKVLLELRKLYVRNLAGMVARREQLMAVIQVDFCNNASNRDPIGLPTVTNAFSSPYAR